MLNNKGFTVVELVMSFAFVSLLSVSLFTVVMNYRDKEKNVAIETELLSFKSKLTIDIQNDIQTKILKSMDYCVDEAGKRLNRCVILNFNKGDSKILEVKSEIRVDKIENEDGTTEEFSYSVPYISYGGIKYVPPDAGNVTIDGGYTLEYTTPKDGLENNLSLYRLNIPFRHNDLDGDMDISIVASGNQNTSIDAVLYEAYNIGDLVQIQVGGHDQAWFRVIRNSSIYDDRLVLLFSNPPAENAHELSLDFTSDNTVYAVETNEFGNRYEGSTLHSFMTDLLADRWTNADVVRPITAEEIGYLVYACPRYQQEDVDEMNVSSADSWLFETNSFWTMSPKLYTTIESGKNVWYLNTASKVLTDAPITSSYGIRPVIEISKYFVMVHESGS